MKKNLIIICIDGCRLDFAQNSKIFKNMLPGTNFFSQSITYAPYTNSSIHALLSGTYGNRNGCFSYWHSYRFKHDNFLTLSRISSIKMIIILVLMYILILYYQKLGLMNIYPI